MAQIQAQEEVERRQREAEAAAAAEQRRQAAAAAGSKGGAGAWVSGTAISQILAPAGGGAPPPAAGKPTSFAELMAVQQQSLTPTRGAAAATQPVATVADPADDGLLWDYGPAGVPPPTTAAPPTAAAQPAPASTSATTPIKGAAAPPSVGGTAATKKGKKSKGGAADASLAADGGNGVTALEAAAGFGGGDAPMPENMQVWCATQMKQLTGNDDTTLADFLYSLPSDDEVHSYLSMYLGSSHAVETFAKEFTLRKRAARGQGESREWQTAGRKGKDSPHGGGGREDENGFNQPKGKKAGRGKKVADPSLLGFSVESSRIMQGEIDFPE